MTERVTISKIDPQEYEGKVVVARFKGTVSIDTAHRLAEILEDIFGDKARKIVVLPGLFPYDIEITFAEDEVEIEL